MLRTAAAEAVKDGRQQRLGTGGGYFTVMDRGVFLEQQSRRAAAASAGGSSAPRAVGGVKRQFQVETRRTTTKERRKRSRGGPRPPGLQPRKYTEEDRRFALHVWRTEAALALTTQPKTAQAAKTRQLQSCECTAHTPSMHWSCYAVTGSRCGSMRLSERNLHGKLGAPNHDETTPT